MERTITFDTQNHKLVVEWGDGSTKEYVNALAYIQDFPDREADCIAMGWDIEAS